MKTTMETPNLANAINDLCQAAESLGGKPVFDHQNLALVGPLREGFTQVFDGINEVLDLPSVIDAIRENPNLGGYTVSHAALPKLDPGFRALAELKTGEVFLHINLAPETKSRLEIGWQTTEMLQSRWTDKNALRSWDTRTRSVNEGQILETAEGMMRITQANSAISRVLHRPASPNDIQGKDAYEGFVTGLHTFAQSLKHTAENKADLPVFGIREPKAIEDVTKTFGKVAEMLADTVRSHR